MSDVIDECEVNEVSDEDEDCRSATVTLEQDK